MSTFTSVNHGDQWAPPNVDPSTFNPTALDIDQWLDMVKAAGCKYAELTTKHHDGFALWPTAHHASGYSPYSVAQTSWYASHSSTDIVGSFVAKCRSRGLNVVLYFSIWDRTYEIRSNTTAATDAANYIAMIEAELRELLTNYGNITAIRTDGWGWSHTPTTPGDIDGGVGGYTNIPFATIYNYVKSIQPNCLFIENNHTHPATNSDIECYEVGGGDTFPGSPTGRTSDLYGTIRLDGDWFYVSNDRHDGANTESPRVLLNEMAQTGANPATRTIGFSVDQTGAVPAEQQSAFTAWRSELPYSLNLALNAPVTASSTRPGNAASVLTDGVLLNDATYLQTYVSASGDQNPWVELDLGSTVVIGRIEIFNINTASTSGGLLRDVTVTVFDAQRDPTYTSSTINPGNSNYAGSYFAGPGQITISPNVVGRYVRMQRAGTGASLNEQEMVANEIQVFPPTRSIIHSGSVQVSGNTSIH